MSSNKKPFKFNLIIANEVVIGSNDLVFDDKYEVDRERLIFKGKGAINT